MHKLVLYFLLLVTCSVAQASVHRWVDKDGKVHFGDKKPDQEAKTFKIKDQYAIPFVEELTPIRYIDEEDNRLLSIVSITLEMSGAEGDERRIGRITCLPKPVDIYWTDGIVKLNDAVLAKQLSLIVSDAGFQNEVSLGSISSSGSLELKGKILDVKINSCVKTGHENRVYSKSKTLRTNSASFVKVLWTLYDPAIDQELFSFTVKGSHHAASATYRKDGAYLSFTHSMKMSINNLLSNKKFVKHLNPVDLNNLKEKFKQALDVEVEFGNFSGSFGEKVDELKLNSVVIKTKTGHGSGVIINDKGYVLTNAHVVGDEEKFEIKIGYRNYRGRLIRKEKIRDVALIKIIDFSSKTKGVKLASQKPVVGDELYVIGTPLKISFQHTITKGIVSAERVVSGLRFIQTDAAINPGNSGGPVFNSTGELVALTVSGFFTNNGASLNINYLIPIDDAIDTLNIRISNEAKSIMEELKSTIVLFSGTEENKTDNKNSDKDLKKKPDTLFSLVKKWMNTPVIKLF